MPSDDLAALLALTSADHDLLSASSLPRLSAESPDSSNQLMGAPECAQQHPFTWDHIPFASIHNLSVTLPPCAASDASGYDLPFSDGQSGL